MGTAVPDTVFTLRDHPVHDGSHEARDRFVTLRVRHRALNNLRADVRATVARALDAMIASVERPGLPNDSDEPVYACELVAQPAVVPVRSVPLDDAGLPDPRLHPRPTVHGVQTAVVVGLAEPVHTDRDHRIKHGPVGGGSYADANAVPPAIVIDGAQQGNAPKSVQTLAHEVGHALYHCVPELSSREAYVNGALADEGAATLSNVAVMREIKSATGQDIGIAGSPSNHSAYEAMYDKFLHDGDIAAARAGMGKIFGSKAYASVPVDGKLVNYEQQYYGGWYDKHFPAKK